MSSRSWRVLFAVLAAVLGAVGTFLLTTVTMDTVADTVVVGLPCVVALAFVALLQGSSGVQAARRADRAMLGLAAAGGALAFWAAPLLVLSQRASDAPSGADVLFLTTSAWGLACVAATLLGRHGRPPVTALAGAVGAVAGAAGLLASWESPSSFSPFAKFPLREALMLAAGLLFAAGSVALVHAARRVGPRIAVVSGLAGAALLGLMSALPSLPSASEIGAGALYPSIYLGIAVAVFALGWVRSGDEVGVAAASVALFAAPIAVMALSVVERMTAEYGPNPIAWSGAFAGVAAIAAGSAVVWVASASAPSGALDGHNPATESARGRSARMRLVVPLGLALAAFLLALASLATPALDALAEGGTGVPFRVQWTMAGFESAAGWLAVAAAGLALASVLVARGAGAARVWAPAAAATVVTALAAVPLLDTTLHTWNRWVPADVQQTYGTEYSRLVTQAHLEPVRIVAMALAVAAVGSLALVAGRRAASDSHEED